MSKDVWELLSQQTVPPPPPQFDRQLHQRVNRSLLSLQIVEFALRAIPIATLQFGRALLAGIGYTLFGNYGSDASDPDSQNSL